MPQAFLSYARQDGEFVSLLQSNLAAGQLDTWRDVDRLRAGDRWPRRLGDAIAAASRFVLIWSASASASDFVELEWTIAVALKRTICIIALDESSLPPTLTAFQAKPTVDAEDAARWLLSQIPETDAPSAGTAAPILETLSATSDMALPKQVKRSLASGSVQQTASHVQGNVTQTLNVYVEAQRAASRSAVRNVATLSDADYQVIRRSYLFWLENELKNLPGELQLHGQPVELSLEQVYVSVRGYPGSASEIEEAKALQEDGEDRYVEPSSWRERDRPAQLVNKWVESIDLGEVFRRHPTTVILGEPGSGKTTLTRWLALAFTTSSRLGLRETLVAQKSVEAGAPEPDRMVSLGETRLPIFIRIADIASQYRKNRKVVLGDLLGYGKSFKTLPVYLEGLARRGDRIDEETLTVFFKQALREEGAVVLLDGLDEIANPEDRLEIVNLIHGFLDSPFLTPTTSGKSNQVLVTSRIIGYDIHPLRNAVARYTIERLSERAISAFSDSWHAACASKLTLKAKSAEETAIQVSAAFKAQIFGSTGSALRELASNAFMLSLLCVLNEEHEQKLPTSRAKLYEVLVARGLRALFTDKKVRNRQLEEFVLRLLMVVAEHIHATTSSGLLTEKVLEETIWPIVEENATARAFVKSPKDARILLVEGTGLMAERGISQREVRQYGFKHQTVQEFLAGKLLVDDLQQAVPNLLRRSTDPRWREAVLLGLGSLCESVSTSQLIDICRELLAAQNGFLPTGAIIMAQLVEDRPNLPDEIITETMVRLLEAYGRPGILREQTQFRDMTENFVAGLLSKPTFPSSWKVAAEEGALRFARLQPAQNVRVLAGLLHKCRVANSNFADTLLGALHDDGQDAKWIVNRALAMIAVSDQLESAASKPVNGIWAKLASKTRQTLRNRQLVESIRFLPGDALSLRSRNEVTGIPAYLLLLREELEGSAALLNQVAEDSGWLKVVIALYGGLGSFETPDLRQTLNDGRSLLGSSVLEDGEAARTAAYLDTEVQPQWDHFKSRVASINPRWMYRDSPLTPIILRRLRQQVSPAELVKDVREIWEGRNEAMTRTLVSRYRESASGRNLDSEAAGVILLTDCLVVLLVVDEIENHPALSTQPSSPLQVQALDRFAFEPDRILAAGRDPALRFRVPLEQAISMCAKKIESAAPDSASPTAATPVTSEKQESDPLALPEFSENAMKAAEELGAFWEKQLSGMAAEPTNRIAIILDCHGQALAARAGALFLSWQFILSSPWSSRQPAGIEEGCLRITHDDPDSVLARCIGGIAKLPETCDFLKVFALSQLPPLYERASGLRMLALAIALKIRQGNQRGIALKSLWGEAEFDEGSIAKEVQRLAESSMTSLPVEAFHTLRYLANPANIHDAKFRTHLLSAALAIRNTKARAVALAQSTRILRFFAEGEAAAKSLLGIVPELADKSDQSELLAFAGLLQSGHADSAHPASKLMAAWSALTELATELEVDPVSALELIGTRPAAENAELLFYYLRYLFVCENDDREYSITVVLDTVGKKLSLPPAVLVAAFSRCVRLAEELNWEGVELLPSGWDEGKDSQQEAFNALLFLWSLPDSFDFLAAWGLSRIGSYIFLTLPDLVPLAAALAHRIKESFRDVAFAGLGEQWRSYPSQDLAEKVRFESLAIADPTFRFHTLRILRRRGVSGISGAALLSAASEISVQFKRDAALRDFVAEFGDSIFLENIQLEFHAVLDYCEPELRSFLLFLLALQAASNVEMAEVGEAGGASPKWGGWHIVLRKTTTEEDGNSRESKKKAIQWLESCASSFEQAEQRTAVAIALLCLRCSAITPSMTGRRKESLWRQLADSTQRMKVIAELVSEGRKGELEFGAEAIETLTDWLARGESTEILEPVLSLVSRATPRATPLLEQWHRRYPKSAIGRWACVMLAERNRWSVSLVISLTDLLQYEGDLLRNRAVMAMQFRATPRGLARSSVVGRDVVVELAEISEQSETLPHGVMLTAVWAFEVLTIDTPGLLMNLRDSYESGASMIAPALFRLVSRASEEVSIEVVRLLEGKLQTRLRAALTRGVISLWTKSWRYQAKQTKFLADLRRALWTTLDSDDPKTCQYAVDAIGLMSDEDEIGSIARLAQQKSGQQANHLRMLAANALEDNSFAAKLLKADAAFSESLLGLCGDSESEVAVAAGTFLLRCQIGPSDIRGRMGDNRRFLEACFSSVDFYFVSDRYRAQVRTIARGLERLAAEQKEAQGLTGDDVFTTALRTADQLMQESRWRSAESVDRAACIGTVLPVCAAAAELMPDLYRRIGRDFLSKDFAKRLAIASRKGDWFTTRESAVVLLCLLRKLSAPFGEALSSICSDVYPVQQALIRQIDRVHEINGDAVKQLELLLDSKSANVLYAAARIIVNTLRNEQLGSHERETLRSHWLQKLSRVVEAVDPNQMISILESGDDRFMPRIRNVALLKHLLQSILVDLSAIPQNPRFNDTRSVDLAQVRVRAERLGEPLSFEFWLGDHVSDDPVTNQRTWLQRSLSIQFSQDLNDALSDLAKVSKQEVVSCAALAEQAQYFD